MNLHVERLTSKGNLPTEALCQCWPLVDVGFWPRRSAVWQNFYLEKIRSRSETRFASTWGFWVPGLQFSVCDTVSNVGQQRGARSCSPGKFSRLFTETSSSSDSATDAYISASLTVCRSPQLPAAIAHHVVRKPLRLTAAIYSCEVLGCLWGLHWPALPRHSLLDCSLQQGTNSVRCMVFMVISIQGLE